MREINIDELEMVSGGYVVTTYYGSAWMYDGYGTLGGYGKSSGSSSSDSTPNFSSSSVFSSFSTNFPYLSNYLDTHNSNNLFSNQSFDLHTSPAYQNALGVAQSNFCQTDPFWSSVISSSEFKAASDIIVTATKSSSNEYAINNYSIFGNAWFGKEYTSHLPDIVVVRNADGNPFINFVVHTHTAQSEPGLSAADMAHDFPVAAIQISNNGKISNIYCYTP